MRPKAVLLLGKLSGRPKVSILVFKPKISVVIEVTFPSLLTKKSAAVIPPALIVAKTFPASLTISKFSTSSSNSKLSSKGVNLSTKESILESYALSIIF
jgi:hypothetical protein